MTDQYPNRKRNRKEGYDYARPGAYFVTICTHGRVSLFGDVVDGVMMLNDFGLAVAEAWENLPQHYPHVQLDAFVIMPNHAHGILWIYYFFAEEGKPDQYLGPSPVLPAQNLRPPIAPTEFPKSNDPMLRHGLPEIVRAFKTFSAREINRMRKVQGERVWQRSYWDHIIRDQAEFNRICDYIRTNPQRWAEDTLHPDAPPNPFNQD